MHSCKAPTCSYSEAKKKCVKPNPYFEALASCKRQGIDNNKCKKEYFADKQTARNQACKRYEEKQHYVKPKKECPEGKVRNPKTGRCIKIRVPKTTRKRVATKLSLVKKSVKIEDSPVKTAQLSSMKSLTDFSSLKPISSKTSSKYSQVFKRQYKERKNAKFVKKQNQAPLKSKSELDPFKKKVQKDVLQNHRAKKLKHHPFIKDMLDEKVKKVVVDEEKHSAKQSLNNSSTSRKVKNMLQKLKATKVQRFLKNNLIKKYFTLEKRVKYYKYVRDFLKNLNQNACIDTKTFKSKSNQEVNGYTINNIIDLEKRIGTDSAYGVIYRTSVKNMLGRAPIATKLMPINKDNKKEITLNMNISKGIVRPQLSRHFLLTYKAFECQNRSIQVPQIIMNTKYYITLNELAHGDLKSLCQNKDYLRNDELVLNMAVQTVLSIMTFHNLGYTHEDCHWGNFLYHMTEDKSGYYHYKINKKDYYLKNCGYTMMIYDFGFSNKYNPKSAGLQNLLAADYTRILQAFKNRSDRGWNKEANLPSPVVSKYIQNLQTSITKATVHTKTYQDMMYNVILEELLRTPVKNLFVDKLSDADKKTIINDSPFIIHESLAARI
jgi:hypothetical protein